MQPEITLQDRYDVVVLGGGMAALSLARLMHLELPEARVLCLEKGPAAGRKVGESTVEIAAHFVLSRLRLADVLQTTQLPKNGIRYWFDSAERDLPFSEASEDGPGSFSWWRTFQLERDSLEQALLQANRAALVPHLEGVKDLEVDYGEPHRVRFLWNGEPRQVEARWVVDASGPGSFTGRKRGLLHREERIPHGSAWAWFKGAQTPETLMGQAGRRRFCFGRRVLSTNSLMSEGYWIWMIPLASGLLSVGVVYDKTAIKDAPRNEEELQAFLARHRMLRDALEGAELVEFGRMDNFAYKPDYWFGPDRTAWIGMAGGFVDPLYSSGLDFIGIQCEYLTELLRRDLGGEAPDPERLRAYNRFLELYYDQTVTFFSGLYRTFVSQELVTPRYRRDVHIYWNLYTWPYFSRQFLELDFLREHAPLQELAYERTRFFARLFVHAYERLKQAGQLHRSNRGVYTFNQLGYRMLPFIRFERQMGHRIGVDRRRVFQEEIDALTFLSVMEVLFDGDRAPLRGLLYQAIHGETMARLIELEGEVGGFGERYWEQAFALISARLRELLAARGVQAPGLDVTPERFRGLGELLGQAAADPAQAELARSAYVELPPLDDLLDLPPIPPEQLQPEVAWGSVPHSPWNLGPIEPRTCYELLGDRWWNHPMRSFPEAVFGIEREL